MLDALLTTKLHIPQAAREFVPRPHLAARLEEGLLRKLTLVSAPAGFGKSTLVADWIRRRGGVIPSAGATTAPLQAAWLSLDEGDNDPARFWTYVIAAIQAVHPDVGHEARCLPTGRSWARWELSLGGYFKLSGRFRWGSLGQA
jgi:LuxR family maltose regulon positive regulatory protein